MKPEDTKRAAGFEKDQPKEKPPTGDSYLLAIGINNYEHFSKLKNATKDVEDFVALMAQDFGFNAALPYTHILLNDQATRANIIQTLSTLCRQVKENDRVLLYYSGHGMLDPITDRGYWIPVEAHPEFEAGYISNSDVRDYIKAMRSRHTLLISDSCFSGALLVREATNDAEGAYEDWERKRSRWLLCSGRGVVSDGQAGKNSPFAAELLQVLRNSQYAKINIALLADKVTKSVRFNYEQQAEAFPFFGAGHEGGQFVFHRPVSETQKEALAFEAAKASRSQVVLIRFLKTTTNSQYKKDIRQILRELEAAEIWQAVNKKSYAGLDEFLEEHPNSPYAATAQDLIDKLLQVLDQQDSKNGIKSEKSNKAPKAEQEKRPPKVLKTSKKLSPVSQKLPVIIPEMVWVEGGSFQMGNAEYPDEKPVHQVTLRSFFMGKYPITFDEYDQFCQATNREIPGDEGWGRGRRPVVNVSWEDAQAYCDWLSLESGLTFRLPSEQEWEFAGKGGIQSKGYKYAGSNELDKVAWYSENAGEKTQRVGEKDANELGLYDMSGNIWEWCNDTYHDSYSMLSHLKAWVKSDSESLRVVRGGSWHLLPNSCRPSSRFGRRLFIQTYVVGFRIARY